MTESKNKTIEEDLKKELDHYVSEFRKSIDPKTEEDINKFLDQELRNEINDQINFLRNTSITAGVVAPLSLTLLSNQSLNIQTTPLLLGFVLLLFTILITLIFTKQTTLNTRYKT